MVFSRRQADQQDEPIDLPCGKCPGCRADKARNWGIRCYHESLLHEQSSLLTLTYSDQNIPADGKIQRDHLSGFLKRLRTWLDQEKLRFFACGEYGEHTHRPHYHVLIFGQDFRANERVLDLKGGYASPIIDGLWDAGHHHLFNLDAGGCFYVAGYESKKLTQPDVFTSMSRNLGKAWVLANQEELRRQGSAIVNGQKWPLPTVYLQWMDEQHAQPIKELRAQKSKKSYFDQETNRTALAAKFNSKFHLKPSVI